MDLIHIFEILRRSAGILQSPVIIPVKDHAAEIKASIDQSVLHFETEPNNIHQLSCDCYSLLLHFSRGFITTNTNDLAWEKYAATLLLCSENLPA